MKIRFDHDAKHAVCYRTTKAGIVRKPLLTANGHEIDDPREAAERARADESIFAFQMVSRSCTAIVNDTLAAEPTLFQEGKLRDQELFFIGAVREDMQNLPQAVRTACEHVQAGFAAETATQGFFPVRANSTVLDRATGRHLLKITKAGRVIREADFCAACGF